MWQRLGGGGAGRALLLALLLTPPAATAHGFGRLYNLPVPFWLYGWASAAVLVLSFLLVAGLARSSASVPPTALRDLSRARWVQRLGRLLPLLRALSFALLLLCIATGWFGNRDPYRNFSMTFFWVVFLLAGTYLAALLGDWYAALNPWRVMTDAVSRLWRGYGQGRLRYPARAGDWPALLLYLAFIWQELFGFGRPLPLAKLLLAYSAINLLGVWLVGRRAWFAHCEFFSLFFRLVALIAPLHYQRGEAGERGSLALRKPFAGLLQQRPQQLSTVVFVLAILATTAFDGLRATQGWVQLFWGDPWGLITGLAGSRPMLAYAELRPWYLGWETFWLLLLPGLYFAAYALGVLLAKAMTASPRPLRELLLDFAYPLLPIALVYHATHYATLLLTQGLKIISLASDPFGWGWNLFGTAWLLRAPILPGMGLVWHAQVGLILFGHVMSVVLAHHVALRVLPTRRAALVSQLPMLLMMVGLTVAGLWIIAQPLTVELMR